VCQCLCVSVFVCACVCVSVCECVCVCVCVCGRTRACCFTLLLSTVSKISLLLTETLKFAFPCLALPMCL
jgi:hypothetical protein